MTMNNTLSKIIIFTAGAAIGSVVTWKIVKTKYEQYAREEIESVKALWEETYGDKSESDENVEEEVEDEFEKAASEKEEYEQLVKDAGYTADQTDITQNQNEEDGSMDTPYVITPEEFGENGYDTVSLNYYEGDGVLTDDCDEPFTDEEIEELVGADFAEHFGEYEDDSVFVRNDFVKVDYEILKDYRKFSEIS